MPHKNAVTPRNKNHTKPAEAKRPLRLLVVEDHPDTRKGLELFLGMFGFEVRFAEDVRSALAAAGEETFDALLSDIGLPDGNGWELLRELEKRGHLPAAAIAMSGFSTAKDLAQSEATGFHAHLIKPFLREDLEAALALAEKKIASTRRKRRAAAG